MFSVEPHGLALSLHCSFEELKSIIKNLRNYKKIKDMSSMCDGEHM